MAGQGQLCLNTRGGLGRELHFLGGLMGFITALQLAGIGTGDDDRVKTGTATVTWVSSSLLAASPLPCLVGLCPSARPSSAGFLRADPALPMQSAQHGAWPPTLGRTVIGK